MRYANVTEARGELLNIVKNVETVTITRNGKPAVVVHSTSTSSWPLFVT